MSILAEFAAYLEVNDCGVMGESIFVNQMSSDEAGILLFGDPEGFMQHTEIENYYRGVYNVTVRHKDTQEGETLADKVFKLLRRQNGLTLGNYRILFSKAEMLPHSFRRNDAGFVEWLLVFDTSFTVNE